MRTFGGIRSPGSRGEAPGTDIRAGYDRILVESGTDQKGAPLKRPACPGCGEPWLRPTQLPGRYRCVYCLQRYELVSGCPKCGAHQTIVRMSTSEDLLCQHCGGSMLQPV
jgi:zinc-ribbons